MNHRVYRVKFWWRLVY